jgi:hypothetical protein
MFTSRHQPGLVALLHSGNQCSSCGIRFTPEQTMKHRQHLDWHFRQNRRQKDTVNKQSRGWYLSVSDWLQYEEIEDPEERGMILSRYDMEDCIENVTSKKFFIAMGSSLPS